MRLEAGTRAPDFAVQDTQGKSIKLSELRGKKWLAFFRYAGCPLCNLQISKIKKKHADLTARGLNVIAVFQSTKENLAEAVGDKQEPPFPLVPDPEEKLYALYGVETSLGGYLSPRNLGRAFSAMAKGFLPGKVEGSATRVPADFLIDDAGTIQKAYYGKVIADHIPMNEVEAFIA